MRLSRLAAVAALPLIVGLSGFAIAQTMHDHGGMAMPSQPGRMAMHGQGGAMPMMMGQHGAMAGRPTQPGQAAFGAVQEIVGMLEADPSTDWSKVDLDALREHLVDMDEVALRAKVEVEKLPDGIRATVTGAGRTALAIERMLPEHARVIDGQLGWHASTSPIENGILLSVTSVDTKQAQKIRGLGFIGIMAEGDHHQMHHLAMAKGEPHP